MKNEMQAKLLNNSLFLMIGFLLIYPFYEVHAQNNSSDFDGIEWVAKPIIHPNPEDNSTTVAYRSYVFEKQGKVTVTITAVKGAGFRYGYKVDSPTFNPQADNPSQATPIYTPSATATEKSIGTYKITGKSISLYFPEYIITATIFNDGIKGYLTDKKTSKKDEWMIARASDVNKSSSGNASPKIKTDNSKKDSDAVKQISDCDKAKSASEVVRCAGNAAWVAEQKRKNENAMIVPGVWNFKLNVNRMQGGDGFVRNDSRNFEWDVKIVQQGEEIRGTLRSGKDSNGESICAEAIIKGSVKEGKVNFIVTYNGDCCYQGQMRFTGELSNGGTTLIGSLEPLGLSKSYTCSLAFAEVTATLAA